MTVYAVTATPQVVAAAGGSWRFTNAGAANVFLTLTTGRAPQVLVSGATITLAPDADVSASTSSGTASLTVVAHAVIHSTVNGGTP